MTKQHAATAHAPPSPAGSGAAVDAGTGQDTLTTLALALVEGFNDRDAEALVQVAHPRIVLRPTALIGRRRTYHGHAGLRRWIEELLAAHSDVQLHVREVRPLPPTGFLVLSKLRAGEEVIADSAMIASVQHDTIVEAHGYLSDETMLARVGLIPAGSPPLR